MKQKEILIIGSVILVAIIIVGGVLFVQNSQTSSSNKTNEVMMKDKNETEGMMEKEEGAMEKEEGTMEKDPDAMKKEEGVMEKDPDKMEKEEAMMKTSGQYIPFNNSSLTSSNNVIFFAANWCVTCRSLDNAINSKLNDIPSNLTILKADYDKETSLKQKYGVTFQHTLVQVDKDGNMLKKWNGSDDISEIVSQLI